MKVKGTGRMKIYLLRETSSSWWPRGLRRRSAAFHFLGMRIRNRPGVWMTVSQECCILSGRGLCDGLIPRPEESYLVYLCVFECVCVCVCVCVTEFVQVQQ
jgi:hypothetical protein